MAAGSLPKPGTQFGPCVEPCQHRDCAATRKMAESICRFCDQPIGYDRQFFSDAFGVDRWIHATCLEASIAETKATLDGTTSEQARAESAREFR